MGTPLLTARGRRRLCTATLLAAAAVSCDPDPMGPGTVDFGPLRVRPLVESAVDPALLGLDSIAVTIRRADDGAVVADTLLDFEADTETILAWVLGIEDLPAMVDVAVTVRRGQTPMFSGSIEVEVVEAPPAGGSAGVYDAPLAFIGPGAGVTTLTVTPGDALLTFGESVQYAFVATEADGTEVPDAVVVWTTSDPALAPIEADALLEAPDARGTVDVIARIPTGVTGTADARFQPAAAAVEVVTGDGTAAPAGDVVPLEVRVVGSDGEGVEGVPVTFAAPAGASVADPVLPSGPAGLASTEGTLGVVAGAYAFTASIPGATAATLTVIANPGPPAALGFGQQPVTTSAGETLPPVTVELRDAFGNVTTGGTPVALALSANPNGASLTGTTQVTSVNGVARFDALSVDVPGLGYTIVASATGLPPAQSAAFDVLQVPTTVTVAPGQAQLVALEATVDFSAAAFDDAGLPIPGQSFTWTTSDAAVAMVDAGGTVTAVGNGTATVTATAGVGGPSDGATVVVEQQAATVAVTPVNAMLDALEAQVQFSSVVNDANGFPLPDQSVVWSSTDAGIAAVDNAGLVTAVANGTASVRAAAGAIVGAADVTVRQVVTFLSVTPDGVTFDALQDQAQLTAVGLDARGHPVTDVAFTWATDDATVADVDNAGKVTAAGNGNATITVTADQATATADVTVQQVAAGLVVTPTAHTLTALAADVTLTAAFVDANGFPVPGAQPVWTTLDPAVATVNSAGVVTSASNGAARIVAAAGGLADTATVTVAQEPSAVTITPDVASLDALAATAQLNAVARDANGFVVAGAQFAWASNDDAVATVDQAGLVTAAGNGDATVSAMTGAAVGAAAVSVQQVAASIAVTPEAGALNALQDQLTLTAAIQDANGFDVAGASPVWTSLAAGVASVSPAGVVTAEANGSAQVVAVFGQLADTATITVQQIVTDVVVMPGAVLLTAIDDQTQLAADPRDANGFTVQGAAVTWSSDDPAVAGVDGNGLVTAAANGATSARARAGAIEGFATVEVRQRVATLALTVTCPDVVESPPAVSGLAAVVVPSCDTLTAFGDQVLIEPEARDANGHLVTDPAITWTSLAPAVATVDASGLVTAVGNGAATIRAEVDGVVAEVDIAVDQAVASITIEPAEVTIGTGEQTPLLATARDANGFVVAGAVFTWTSDIPVIATVDPSGLVTGGEAGTTTVEAAANGIAGSATVTVE